MTTRHLGDHRTVGSTYRIEVVDTKNDYEHSLGSCTLIDDTTDPVVVLPDGRTMRLKMGDNHMICIRWTLLSNEAINSEKNGGNDD
jgi:hypothetical protein